MFFCVTPFVQAQEIIRVDDMTDAQTTPAGGANWVSGSDIIGGEREILNVGNIFQIEIADGSFSGTTDSFTSVRIVYDGPDEDAENIDYAGLDGLDLSGVDVLRISDVQAFSAAVSINVVVFSDEANASGMGKGISIQQGVVPEVLFPFSDFDVLSGDGVDWGSVGAIVISFQGQFGNVKLEMKEIDFDEVGFIPVELSGFDALVDGSNVNLTWQTESERNNAGFEVQHARTKEGPYETIAYITGNGTSLARHVYEHTMQGAGPGIHFFQLKQVDYDGTFVIYETRAVHLVADEGYTLGDAYPNPFNPSTNFELTVSTSQRVQVDLYDLLGRVQQRMYDGYLESGRPYTFQIDAAQLSSGTYLYRVQGERFGETKRIVLAR